MGEDLSNLSEIRTNRVVRTPPKSGRRRQGQQGQFESHLGPGEDAEDEKETPAPAGSPAPTEKRTGPHGRLIDFTA